MSTAITDNPMVRELQKRFNLEAPFSYRIVVTDYEFTSGGVTIRKATAYDTENNPVKDVDFSKLKGNEHLYTFIFRKL